MWLDENRGFIYYCLHQCFSINKFIINLISEEMEHIKFDFVAQSQFFEYTESFPSNNLLKVAKYLERIMSLLQFSTLALR